jgi:hypothetical protein
MMHSNPFFASLFALSFVTVSVNAQTPAPDNDALAQLNFTTAQKQGRLSEYRQDPEEQCCGDGGPLSLIAEH